VAGTLRLDLAQYRDLAAFAQFGTEQLDKATQAQLARGQRLVEILKQDQYQPLPVEKQVLIIYAAANRYLEDLEVSQCRRFELEMYPFIETNYNGLLKALREKKAFDDTIRAEATKALDAFKETFKATLAAKSEAEAAAKEEQKAAPKVPAKPESAPAPVPAAH
jgi:F-type H+-transporting ATPase subunit alpha